MKNKYTPVLIIIMIFGFVWVFLLAKAGTERVKGESVMNKKTMVVEADKNAIPPDMETAIFAAGCFWGVQEYFSRVKGVIKSESGYTGGTKKNPTYEEVCTGKTGHAESVRVIFDPRVVSYERLLQHFWELHDPTSLNKQGNDVGSQYRSAIFYTNPEQEMHARSSLEKLVKSGKYSQKIVTEILPAKEFYTAEEYHQNYLKKNPYGYCH
ncbi:MAG: peptide-methionine (S)-S-oxide reductase MsrA, partial [Smithella sp.]